MFKKILILLTGLQDEEQGLDIFKTTFSYSRPEVIILRAVDPLTTTEVAGAIESMGKTIGQTYSLRRNDAVNYISTLTEKLESEGNNVRGEVADGRADKMILECAERNKVDLIIMSGSRQLGGVFRRVLGNIEDSVLQQSNVPVLIIPIGTQGKCLY